MAAIFLDRDGVVIEKAEEGNYISCLEQVRFIDGALSAVQALFEAGFDVFIVTNQRGIALGKIKPKDLEEIHACILSRLAALGVTIRAIYVCPHDKGENCFCRKPKPGMLMRAATDYDLDLRTCWMIGDASSDIEAGQLAGCRTIWITRPSSNNKCAAETDHCSTDLADAVKYVLKQSSNTVSSRNLLARR